MNLKSNHAFLKWSAALAAVQIIFFSTAVSAKPAFHWSPGKLSVEQMQATQTSHTFSVTPSRNMHGVIVRVVPELMPWVTVSPASLDDLQKDQPVEIKLNINLPPEAPEGTYEGTIQLRENIVGQPQRNLAKPLPIKLVITEREDNGLPPDPGEEGRRTLLGVDSDDDGVRDDIQRYIHSAYIDDETVQMALTEVAKQYQALLAQADDPDAAFNHATRNARHGECLDFLKGEEAADILAGLKAEILNTRERSLAYIAYNENLAGEMILGRPLTEWADSCAFSVETTGEVQ